jgi:hypothetical protein
MGRYHSVRWVGGRKDKELIDPFGQTLAWRDGKEGSRLLRKIHGFETAAYWLGLTPSQDYQSRALISVVHAFRTTFAL